MPATIVIGLGFGDEGKGSIVDYLVRREQATAVVRFNGGAQCAHHVVAPDGRQHTFAQFGSGTLVHAGVETMLSDAVLVNPLNLLVEEAVLHEQGVTNALDRLMISPGAVIITPIHVAANRLAEISRRKDIARHDTRHGSCGQGIGEARSDSINGVGTLRASDLRDRGKIERMIRANVQRRLSPSRSASYRVKLLELMPPWAELIEAYQRVGERVAPIAKRLREQHHGEHIIFEGAQGILLDETFGVSPPHVTWTDTTAAGAHAVIADTGIGEVKTIGVTRSYLTRHGPGPFPTESAALTKSLQDETNTTNEWQGPFRVGALDLDLLRYATRIQPVDEIALNHLDRYPAMEGSLGTIDAKIFEATGAPVTIAGYGPTADDKQLVPRLAASELRR